MSWGFSWFFVCWVILDWSRIFGYYIVRLWTSLGSRGECAASVLAGRRSGFQSLPAFMGFSIRSGFKAFMVLFRSVPCVPPPGQCGTPAVVSPEPQHSESRICCWGLYPCMHSPGASPELVNSFMGLFSWAPPSSQSPRYIVPAPGTSSPRSFGQKAGLLLLPLGYTLPEI